MNLPRCSNKLLKLPKSFLSFCSQSTKASSEYVDTPQYPEPLPVCKSYYHNLRQEWYDRVNKLPTIEQKLIEMNMPKYYKFWSCLIEDATYNLNSLEFLKFVTRTHVVKNLPEDYYAEFTEDVENILPTIRSQVEDVILLQAEDGLFRKVNYDSQRKEKWDQSHYITNINHICLRELCHLNPELLSITVDNNPRIESTWIVGGFKPDKHILNIRKHPTCKAPMDEPVDRYMRGKVCPVLSIRSKMALPEVVAMDHSLATEGDLPQKVLWPQSCGYPMRNRRFNIIPGFWPGEANENGFLFYQSENSLKVFKSRFGTEFLSNAEESLAMASGFTQASAFGFYQGTSPMTEVIQPITQQSMLTNGQDWRFYVYQLNTSRLYDDYSTQNPRNNIMWLSESEKLYDSVQDGKIIGFNDEVLKKIIKMYLKRCTVEYPLPPHGYKYIKDHDAPSERIHEFHKQLMDVMTNRPPSGLKPEIYMWEKIYKIKFKTRPAFKKVRFFEVPWRVTPPGLRKLNEGKARYIPKQFRFFKKMTREPKLDSEKLFKYEKTNIKRFKFYPEDAVHQTINKKREIVKPPREWEDKEEDDDDEDES